MRKGEKKSPKENYYYAEKAPRLHGKERLKDLHPESEPRIRRNG